ncbi:PAS domain S-box protein [Spirosoma aerophilum]
METSSTFPSPAQSPSDLRLENERLRQEKQQLEETVRQQQMAIAQAEQRWTFAMEGVGDVIWEYNLQTGKVARSTRVLEILGYSGDELPDTIQGWKSLVHPQDIDLGVTYEIDEYKSGRRQSHSTAYRLRCKDGSYKFFLDRGRLFNYSDDGKPLLVIGTMTDITHQKFIEDALRKNANRQANLIASLQDGILFEDEERAIVLVNQHFCDLFSIPATPDQMKGMDCSGMAEQSKNFFKDPEKFVAGVNKLLADQKAVTGEELELADGRIFERDYVPIFMDNVYSGHLWKYIDITTRKRAQEVSLRQREKFQRIIENMNLGLIEVDLDDRIVYTNQSFCTMSGYEPDELVGHIAIDILLKGQNVEFMKEKNDSRLSGTIDAYEVAVKNKRGDAMWWLISGAPLYSETGDVIGSTGIHLDITKQKQLESELRIAKQGAEDSSRAKELFLANMSHEIRTPMNAILNLGQQLTKTVLTDQQHFYLSMINKAASNLLVIINDILDFSKIEAGELSLEHIGFNMPELIQQAVLVMAQNADKKGLRLSANVDPNLAPVLLGDPYRLNQILLNLLGNAIKFTEEGSIIVQCKCATHGARQEVDITVSDTGIGIDPGFQESLFTKFTQEDESIGRRYGGTGLGMSITKQLVDLMGGTIRVESQKNQGTSVYVHVSFPIGSNTNLVIPKQETQHDRVLKSKRILLVEDNTMNRLVVRMILDPFGVDLTEVDNGVDALDVLRGGSFDLVLMDVQMPIMDGLEATRIIRREISPSIPIIALTASAIRSDKEECFKAGMDDFLAKPFDEKELIDQLVKWLNCVDTVVEKPTTTRAHALYDLSMLETISQGNQDFIQKMISLFCSETPAVASQIRTAYEAEDFEKVKYLAHRIKPSIESLGIYQQKEAIRQIEHLAKEGQKSTELAGLILAFEKTIGEVVADMQTLYPD